MNYIELGNYINIHIMVILLAQARLPKKQINTKERKKNNE
jgi:hypothetical protein